MSVTTMSDIGGHTITLNVNGARLTMDLHTAHQVCEQLAYQLDSLARDHAAKALKDRLEKEYGNVHH